MKQETISKAKAAQLFAENAVLFGRADGVPEQAAKELFGSSAVAFAKRQQNAGTTFNGYGIGDYTAWYLTEYGFYIAATYRNVERIREGDGWNE
jgi:predicted homoserine dehydrogenase-like protein